MMREREICSSTLLCVDLVINVDREEIKETILLANIINGYNNKFKKRNPVGSFLFGDG